MSEAPVWKKVGVDVQTALAASLTVSGISKASPAVLSYGAGDTDPTNGDYFLIEASGMSQINNMVVRVSAVDATANTFACEGLDSTLFDDFVSATAKKITFGKSMSTMMDISSSGGDTKYADNSDLHTEMDQEIPVGFSALKFTSNSRFIPDDAALLALQAASRAKTPLCIKFRFANGAKVGFYANISAPLHPAGQNGGVVQTPVAFGCKGFPAAWAS